jgi:ribosomal-protein-alanine N-acetyltransferase
MNTNAEDIYVHFVELHSKGDVGLIEVKPEHCDDLLKCYSDRESVPFFNSDNCDGDDFYYSSRERMKKAMDFWHCSYKNKYFVRWAVKYDYRDDVVGTVEMFRNDGDEKLDGHYGVLRIDLRSDFEKAGVVGEILQIADSNFAEMFGVDYILTKSFPNSNERIAALENHGYKPLGRPFREIYPGYYIKKVR